MGNARQRHLLRPLGPPMATLCCVALARPGLGKSAPSGNPAAWGLLWSSYCDITVVGHKTPNTASIIQPAAGILETVSPGAAGPGLLPTPLHTPSAGQALGASRSHSGR